MQIEIPSCLSDAQLLAAVEQLAQSERDVTVLLIAHLVEVENRRLYLSAGFSSLFVYCTKALRLSEHAAYHRIEAARAARRCPRLLEMLAAGSLNLTTVLLLAERLSPANREELLAEAAGKSKREVEDLLARHFPRPDVFASVRKLPAPSLTATPAANPAPASERDPPPRDTVTTPNALPPRGARPVIAALAPDRYKFAFTGDRETREMLDLATDMLRHAVPGGDTGQVMKRALLALLVELSQRKFGGAAARRRGARASSDPGFVPAAVRCQVWIRDRGRCVFTAVNGQRCGERGWVEFHHVLERARGGQGTPENIELRCRAHNAYEADLAFGERRPAGEWDVPARRWAATT